MADNINDDFTDLTEEEGSGETEEKKEKPKREPRQRKPPKEESQEPNKKAKKGKKKGKKLKIILIIVLVLLVAGFVFEEVYYNILGTRDMLIDAVVKLDPDFRAREAKLDEREASLLKLQTELDARERTASSRETQNLKRTTELDDREKTLDDLQQRLTPLYRRAMTEQELEDMVSLSRSYSRMAPEDAAVILLELSQPDDVAAILYYMNERNAAAILAVMEPEFAATITDILLYK